MIYWVCGFLFGLIVGAFIVVAAIVEMERDRVKGERFTLDGKVYKYTEVCVDQSESP